MGFIYSVFIYSISGGRTNISLFFLLISFLSHMLQRWHASLPNHLDIVDCNLSIAHWAGRLKIFPLQQFFHITVVAWEVAFRAESQLIGKDVPKLMELLLSRSDTEGDVIQTFRAVHLEVGDHLFAEWTGRFRLRVLLLNRAPGEVLDSVFIILRNLTYNKNYLFSILDLNQIDRPSVC
jgi:hypothetical protein